MAWTEITRRRYCRDEERYASNLTDAEWALIEPFMPAHRWRGRPRSVSLRMIMNAILFMLTTGCQWRQIPREFAPFTTVQSYFYRFSRDGTLERINHALVMMAREQAGREPTPTAGVIDSQSVKTTEAGGPRGFDAGKKINGRKRHIITDTLGHLVGLDIHTADIQDRDGAVRVIKTIRSLHPWRSCSRFRQSEGLLERQRRLRHLFADGGDAGPKLKEHLETIGTWTLQIVKRSDAAKGFVLLPRRWVVERTLAWLGRCRRLARDFEATIQSAAAWVFLAHIRRLTQKIARR